MTDTQAPEEPYEVDDRVRIQLTDGDAESPYEGTVCRIAHVFVDELDAEVETGLKTDDEPEPERERERGRAAYRLEDVESDEVLPVVLRHRDLVPVAKDT